MKGIEANTKCEEFVTYKIRYVSLLLLVASLVIAFFQSVQYSSIGYVLIAYYDVGYQVVNFSGIISNLCFVLFFYPIAKFVEKYGFRITMIAASGLNALGTVIKCAAVERDKFWLLMIGQSIVSVVPLLFLSVLPVFAASWFRCSEVANVFGIGNAAISIGLLASFLPAGVMFSRSLSISDMESGLSLMTFVTAVISIATFSLIIIFVEDKPPTAPSSAELKRIESYEKRPFKVLLKNRNAMLVILCYALSNGLVDIHVVTLSQAVMTRFCSEADVLTIAGLLFNASGIPSSCVTGALMRKYPKYKLNHVIYALLCVIFTASFIISLNTVNTELLYFSTFVIGYAGNALIVILLDYLVEVSYPFPESISFAIAETLAFIPGLLIVPLITYLTDIYGAVVGNYILLPMVVANLVFAFYIKEDLKRTDADNDGEATDPMLDRCVS